MNCSECLEKLAAYMEDLLSREESHQLRKHLDACDMCSAEYEAFTHLQQRLIARGKVAVNVSVTEPVMRQVLRDKAKPERKHIMAMLRTRWGMGLSAAAGIVLIVLSVILVMPRGQANAAEILARGARAISELTSVHMQCRLRTLPNDNFSYIDPDHDFVDVEIWKQFGDRPKWRIDKPGRLAVMDGQSTIHYMKFSNTGVRIEQPTRSAFDTDWLHEVANASRILTNELHAIQAQESVLQLDEEVWIDSKTKAVVTIESKPNLPDGDYLKNTFFSTADTRRVYVFDMQTDRLEAVKVFLMRPSGDELIFEVNRIDYNPSFDAGVFHPELPENVAWIPNKPTELPDNESYASLTSEQATRKFFEAVGAFDWDEAGKFSRGPIPDPLKEYFGGLEIVSIGESFTSAAYPGVFVPYEIRLLNGEIKKHNLALKKDKTTGRWIFDGGL